MRIIFFGDVVGRSGRDALVRQLPRIKGELKADLCVVNGENSAGGFGITPQIAKEMFKAGADVITGGDHIWDQKDIVPYIASEPRLLRPYNFPESVPGHGSYLVTLTDGRKCLVLHLQGQIFMRDQCPCPFIAADKILETYKLGSNVDAIFVDFHAEATSEKNGMGLYLDGRVSAVIGSHTHVPTADARIFPGGTAYQTDAGMCGDYYSVIGFKHEVALRNFTQKAARLTGKRETANGTATLRYTLVEVGEKGRAAAINPGIEE